MKHIFIINPIAGKQDSTSRIKAKLSEYDNKLDYEIYITQRANDATEYIRDYCTRNPNNKTVFYSCGGDGTLNECLNGIVGFDNVMLACYPVGSGNDFIKAFGKKEDFMNLDNMIDGYPLKIDIIKSDKRYALNICNFGFDAEACKRMIKVKRLPFISGKSAYNIGVVHAILFKMKHAFKIVADDETIYDERALLLAVGNGICYGGGFYCTPIAKVNDGLLDICIVKKISRLSLAALIKYYKRGKHLNNESLAHRIIYKKVKKVVLRSSRDITFCLDGEIEITKKVELSVVPKAINFILPKGIIYE